MVADSSTFLGIRKLALTDKNATNFVAADNPWADGLKSLESIREFNASISIIELLTYSPSGGKWILFY